MVADLGAGVESVGGTEGQAGVVGVRYRGLPAPEGADGRPNWSFCGTTHTWQ